MNNHRTEPQHATPPVINSPEGFGLVMACCANKLDHAAPAIDLYVSRSYNAVRAQLPESVPLAIQSAKLGLVPSWRVIDPYEQKMTAKSSKSRAAWCAPQYSPLELRLMPQRIYVYGGALYRDIIRQHCAAAGKDYRPIVGQGRGCGDHFSALQEFLVDAQTQAGPGHYDYRQQEAA